MLDIHCHIFPGVDDGAATPQETERMLRLAVSGKTEGIIVTPHANLPGKNGMLWSVGFDECIADLNAWCKRKSLPLRLYPGQEIFCTGAVLTLLREGRLIALNHSRYLLVEFDFREGIPSVTKKLRQLEAEGYVPVAAHPERYAFVQEDPDAVRKMIDCGAVLQCNAGSLLGVFGTSVQQTALRILRHGYAHFIASDAHGTQARSPFMSGCRDTVERAFGTDYAEVLFDKNPEAVVNNRDILFY